MSEQDETNPRDFGAAIKALKSGYKVARDGWNGKGMFIYYVCGSLDPNSIERMVHAGPMSEVLADVEVLPHINMKAADGSIVCGWLASQTDMLAEDWTVIHETVPA